MKKIMFSDRYGLTEAVLEGRKTMTRRIIPDKLISKAYETVNGKNPEYALSDEEIDGLTDIELIALAPYRVGEEVAIAQAYKNDKMFSGLSWYKEKFGNTAGWRNKMFVNAEDMNERIRITDVRIERLKEISYGDCLREGIMTLTEGRHKPGNGFGWDSKADALKRETFLSPQAAFAALIDSISGKGTWESNPLVFVYEFELVK